MGVFVLIEVLAFEIPINIVSSLRERYPGGGRLVLGQARAWLWTYSSQKDMLCMIH